MKTKLDARGVTTTYGYDHLNRLKSISYSGGPATPPVTYTYGLLASDGLEFGQLTSASAGPATYQYTYDQMGRVTQQMTTLASAFTPKYMDTLRYWAHGAMKSGTYGNNLYFSSTAYNSRLHPTGFKVGTNPSTSDVMGFTFAYTLNNDPNNGMLRAVHDTVLGKDYLYDYIDPLNRLTEAKGNGHRQTQTFSHDRAYRIQSIISWEVSSLPATVFCERPRLLRKPVQPPAKGRRIFGWGRPAMGSP